jgi:transcriptional regulator with XRE-family HTH domain
LRAGLNQRQLAHRANTAQSVVARIETGHTSPSFETLARLLGAAGFAVEARLADPPPDTGDALDDTPRILALTPESRLHELRNVDRFLQAVQRV